VAGDARQISSHNLGLTGVVRRRLVAPSFDSRLLTSFETECKLVVS
jgi:hypothetical protein